MFTARLKCIENITIIFQLMKNTEKRKAIAIVIDHKIVLIKPQSIYRYLNN